MRHKFVYMKIGATTCIAEYTGIHIYTFRPSFPIPDAIAAFFRRCCADRGALLWCSPVHFQLKRSSPRHEQSPTQIWRMTEVVLRYTALPSSQAIDRVLSACIHVCMYVCMAECSLHVYMYVCMYAWLSEVRHSYTSISVRCERNAACVYVSSC